MIYAIISLLVILIIGTFLIIFICQRFLKCYLYLTISNNLTDHHIQNTENIIELQNNILIENYIIEWIEFVKYFSFEYNSNIKQSCIICLEDFSEKQTVTAFSMCGPIPHIYCSDCILKYGNTIIKSNEYELNIKCPICKNTIWSNIL